MATLLHPLDTKEIWALIPRITRSKYRAQMPVPRAPKTQTPTFWEQISMAFHLETGVLLAALTTVGIRWAQVRFLALTFRTKTKTIIKISSHRTHSNRCSSSLHSKGERISSREKDSLTTKLTIQWTSRTRSTIRMGLRCQKTAKVLQSTTMP